MSNMPSENPNNTPLTPESTAVQSYLTALQAVITRMATNSANCKTLCLTLIVAILAIVADKSKNSFTFVAFMPILVMGLLDAYYLGLEQGFRNTYDNFVDKLFTETTDKATSKDLYYIKPTTRRTEKKPNVSLQDPIMATFNAFSSFSVYPFYLTLITILVLGKIFVFK
jgi:hypothetical protein